MVQVSTLAAVCCFFLSALPVLASPLVALDAELARRTYTLSEGPIHWKGVVEEGGEEVQLIGNTFEEIEAQAKIINPAFAISNYTTNSTANVEARDAALAARWITHIGCEWPPGWTRTWDFTALHNGIEYLKGLQGWCLHTSGPRTCDRVSCSWGSAVYWCNDNQGYALVLCAFLGHYAADIVSQCADQGANGRTLGQAFDSGNWNVIVAAGDC
ncbi:hypothetical protein QBC34DRAFT_380138 [Podospora aff. communis PSN243]|uniref:Uncharacterized protein n=1 Tax=Podospora aff. communis PSN243 TaxID=3040156 RepID=A0AAV9GMH9_9PEZI|nr:hypothetical protein QBC34DRAFT_380138 [Podospora aff. communis PSN243]